MFPSNASSLPWVQNALNNWERNFIIQKVTITNIDFRAVETLINISFKGVVQIASSEELLIKPEGQRAWKWLMIHSRIDLYLQKGEYIIYNNKKFRVMDLKDYSEYGYYEYQVAATYE